jgi:hypothetical protein
VLTGVQVVITYSQELGESLDEHLQ